MRQAKEILISAAALLTLAASCITELDIDNSKRDPRLVMNAELTTGKHEHTVFLTVSAMGECSIPEEDAVVRCYVNGEPVTSTSAVETVGDFQRHTITADFSGGDKVRLEAEAGGMKVHAENRFPEACTMSVDSSSVKNPEITGWTGATGRTYSFTMTVQDPPNQDSWFRALQPECRVIPLGPDGETPGQIITLKGPDSGYYSDSDPVFGNVQSSAIPDPDISSMLGLSSINSTLVFTDELFKDGSYSFHFEVDQNELPKTPKWKNSYMVFSVAAIGEDDYRYFSYVNAARGFSPFSQPISSVSNVTGGLGYVAAMSVTETMLQMAELE